MALFKCSVCNYIYEGEELLDKCPMCGASKDKMEALSDDVSTKIYRADFTNGLHTDVISMATSIITLCEDGVEDNLDPMCVNVFNRAKNLAWEIKQLSKSELSNHVRKEKF